MHKYLSLFVTFILLWYSCEINAQVQEIPDQAYPELKPIPEAELDKLRSIPEIDAPVEKGRYLTMPAVVDNSLKPFMRPLIAQVGLECGQASSIGNGFTYEIDCYRDLPANVPENQYPTHFAYNFLNGGSDAGVSFFETWEILKKCGTPNVADYGGMANGGASRWISGYENYYHGMQNRLTEVRTIHAGTPEGIALLKGWIWDHLDGSPSGGVANFYSQFTSSFYVFPPGTPEEGKHVITEWGPYPNHAMTIVGYNDSIRWDYNDDGLYTNHIDINNDGEVNVKDWEIGGFKMANTYGSLGGWGDQGYAYMMYKTLGDETETGGIWEHATSVVKVKTTYAPKVTMKVTLKHTSREKLRVTAGLSADTNATEPDYILGFPIFDFQGGDHYMKGGTANDDKILEFGLDLNPLLGYVSNGQRVKYFLQVHENDPSNAAPGEIVAFSVINYEDGMHETHYPTSNTSITNNDITRIAIIKSCEFSKPVIVNTSLPPATLYEPYSCQLTASGGSQPYRWSIKKDYLRSDGTESFPMISAGQVTFSNNNDGQAELPLGFSFPFYGKLYDMISIHADGYLMFNDERYPWPYLISEKTMFTNSRSIAPYACNPMIIDPSSGGGAWFEGNDTCATVRWKCRMFDNPSTTLNFAVRLYASGKIELLYGQMINNGWVSRLAGISDGDGLNYLYTEEPGQFILAADSKAILDPVLLPLELSLDENGLLSGVPEQIHQGTPINFVVTDNNNICTFATLPFTTEGVAISTSFESGSDDRIEFGETAFINVALQNLTGLVLNQSQLTLEASDPYITLIDTQEDAGTIQPGQTVTFNQAFAFDVSSSVPDKYPVSYAITVEGSRQTWSRNFQAEAYAPALEIARVIIADHENGLLDPGETADVKALLRNSGGALATGITALLSTLDPYLTINSSNSTLDSLGPGASDTLFYNVTAAELAPTGYSALGTVDLLADKNFSASTPMIFMIGLIIEDFETGDFSKFDWTFSGITPWFATMVSAWEGSYCARSGTILDNQNSAMELNYYVAQDDSLSFYRRVSSEDDYDFLRFSVDNEEYDNWSGEENWARFTYAVEKGNRIFKWDYTKDYSLSSGSDRGWVDYIQLPAYADPVGISSVLTGQLHLKIYPNPSAHNIFIEYSVIQDIKVDITLYSANGKPLNKYDGLPVQPGTNHLAVNLDGFAAGVYYCVLTTRTGRIIRPFILLGER